MPALVSSKNLPFLHSSPGFLGIGTPVIIHILCHFLRRRRPALIGRGLEGISVMDPEARDHENGDGVGVEGPRHARAAVRTVGVKDGQHEGAQQQLDRAHPIKNLSQRRG